MKVNAIQIDTYAQNAVTNSASKDYSVLVNGEKFVVGSTHAQNFGSKDAVFNGVANNAATKKGYAVLINGEKYIVGVGKDAIAKTNNAKQVLFDAFKHLPIMPKKADKSLNVIA